MIWRISIQFAILRRLFPAKTRWRRHSPSYSIIFVQMYLPTSLTIGKRKPATCWIKHGRAKSGKMYLKPSSNRTFADGALAGLPSNRVLRSSERISHD